MESRLPVYAANNPKNCFAQVEAQFTSQEILSQATKYTFVMGTISVEISTDFGDLIDQVPELQTYDKLKAAVKHRPSDSDENRLHQLLKAYDLGTGNRRNVRDTWSK